METKQIQIPHKFNPRPYQLPILRYMDSWWLRAVQVWHRRTWKDKTDFAAIVVKKALERVWLYFYIFPTYSQWKKVLWDGIDKDGMKVLDHIPKQLVKRKDSTEMIVELTNWSIIQIVWTDWKNIDRLVGTNPVGVVFSEYSLQNPRAWDLLRPILMENGWWAVFNFTPRWENHAYDLYLMAEWNPKWFCQTLTVNDTKNEKWERIVTDAMIQEERDSGMDEDLLQQEYYVSFQALNQWAYYNQQIKKAKEEWRFTVVPYEPWLPVDTFWDLWVNDTTAIWFYQILNKEIRVIDYIEASWEWLSYYLWEVQKKWYNYWFHHFPHDIRVREFTSGKSREQTLLELWVTNMRIVDNFPIADWIDAVRRIFQYCYFDQVKCKAWIDALKDYHKEYDEKRMTYKDHPDHNWASNWADAFRYFAITYLNRVTSTTQKDKTPVIFVNYDEQLY